MSVNERIRARQVRIVDDEGKQVGVLPTREALFRARGQGLDLVQVSVTGDTAVCRILDAGKFLFDRKKQERESARRQRELQIEIKEVQLRPGTDDHDLAVKGKRAREFLAEGDKVKVVVRFRGRERAHKDLGHKVVAEFLAFVGEHKIERPLTDMGRDMQMVLAPVKSKSDLVRERTK